MCCGPDHSRPSIDQAAADAGAHDDAEDDARAPARPRCRRLGEREAVGVVLDHHRQAEAARADRRAGRGRSGTCVFEFFIRPVRLEIAPGVPTPMRRIRAPAARSALDQRGRRSRRCGRSRAACSVGTRSRRSTRLTGVIEHDALDLGPAEIDADAARHAAVWQVRLPAECNRSFGVRQLLPLWGGYAVASTESAALELRAPSSGSAILRHFIVPPGPPPGGRRMSSHAVAPLLIVVILLSAVLLAARQHPVSRPGRPGADRQRAAEPNPACCSGLIHAIGQAVGQRPQFVWFFTGAPLLVGVLLALLVGLQRDGRWPRPRPHPSRRPRPSDGALRLLALLQQEGRLIDFLEEDIEPYSDAQVGAAVRAIHAGCRKALHERMRDRPHLRRGRRRRGRGRRRLRSPPRCASPATCTGSRRSAACCSTAAGAPPA